MTITIDITALNSKITQILVDPDRAIITAKDNLEASTIWNVLATCVKWSKREEAENKLEFTISSYEPTKELNNEVEEKKEQNQNKDQKFFKKPYAKLLITGNLHQAAEYLKDEFIDDKTYKRFILAIENKEPSLENIDQASPHKIF